MDDIFKTLSFTVMGLFLMLVLLGLCTKEEPLPETHWDSSWQEELLQKNAQSSASGNSISFPSKRAYKTSYDYEIDDEDTWDEFLEDIEMRGLEYTDPEAVEIWELDYK